MCLRKSLVLILLSISIARGGEHHLRVTIDNPGDFIRENETIEVARETLRSAFVISEGRHFVVTEAGGTREILCQLTDEALLFQTTIPPHSQKTFSIALVAGPVADAKTLVDGRYVLPREDYAWENDRIAFRIYGPALASEVNNGIDVWNKRTRSLIVAKWYKEAETSPAGHDPYHVDRGEGADMFDVGRTLGAGGAGLWVNGAVVQPGVFVTQKTVTNGPIRIAFEVTYHWTIGASHLDERQRISLDAGQNLNTIQVIFEGDPLPDDLTVACGLVKRARGRGVTDESHGVLALWGPTNADSVNEFLGTGIVVPLDRFLGFADTPVQQCILAAARTGAWFTYYAGAGWTRSGDFVDETSWMKYLQQKAESIRQPLRMEYHTSVN